ncbi:Ig-like domain-containing protein, partial [Telluribacter sp.]|uniref:Ig-like domain-containing protein n=1 Tax=Telluribacter sp. TaxID=1978767 RepID=UPI002E123A41|nr:cadherin-like domain-containing protein [Telluribacter sp.]
MKNIYSLIIGATLLALWLPFSFNSNDFTFYEVFRIEETKPGQSEKPDKKARVLLSKSPLRVKRQGVAALLAPALTATKTYALTNDTGLTGASAGDELEYTIVITNSGDTDATGVSFTDQIDANTTLVDGSLKVSPVAQNDTYQTIGNVGLTIPAESGVLANDINPGSGTLVITSTSPITTSQNGTVTLNTTTGAFTYEPAPGYTGGNDTFTYTLSNGSDLTTTATVTISVTGEIWFVNNAASSSGTGTLSNPFRQMSDFNAANTGASGKPGDNDFVFIYTGSGDYTGAATLRAGQKLIGQGATTTLLAITGYTAPSGTNQLPATNGTNPVLTTTVANTNALNLGAGNTLRGLTLGNTTGSKIAGTNFGTLTVSEVLLTGNGQALNLSTGTLAATFTSIASANSSAAGINLSSITGNLTSSGGTIITNPATQGINVNTASSGTLNFGTTSITGTGGTGLSSTGFANTLQFSALNIDAATGQRAIDITGATGTLTTTSGTISDNISIVGTGGGVTLNTNFTSISSTNSTTTGISLSNVAGNLTSGTTTITNPTTQGINVSGTASTGTFNFGTSSITGSGSTGLASTGFANTLQFGSLTITPDANQKGIDITGATGTLTIANTPSSSVTTTGNTVVSIAGSSAANRVTLNGTFTSISSTNSTDTGISLSNVAGSLTSGTTTINNPTTQGINVSGTASTGTFNFGTTSITGSGGTGLASTGFANTLDFSSLTVTPDAGQKGIDITGATGTLNITASPDITTSNNTAVSIAGVSSVSKVTLGVTLTKVVANGSAKGISLTNTAGTFQVTGSGSTDGSGGTIQNTTARGAEFINAAGITLKNMNFLSANTTDGCSSAPAGISFSGCNGSIYLESVSNVIIDNININSTNGSDANGTNSQRGITGTGISGLTISNTVVKNTGNATEEGPIFLQNLSGTVNLTSLNLTGNAGVDDLFRIENTSTTSTITIDGSTFSNTQTSVNGSYGLIVSNFGTGTTTVNVKNSAFNQIRTQGVKGIAEGTGTLNYNITGCTFDPQAGIGSAIDLVSNQSGTLNFNILNNPTAKARGTSVINIVSQGSSNAQGRINNNTITHVGGFEDSGNGVRVHAEENSSLKVQINGNTITGVPSEAGILARSRNGSGRLDVIITNNNITLPNPTNEIGHNIQVEAGTSNSTFSNPTCAYVANNTNGGRSQFGFDFRVRVVTTGSHIIYLQGTGTSATDIWNNNNNSPKTTTTGTVSQSGTWGTTIQSGTCNAPSNPSVARMMADTEAAELEESTAKANLAVIPGAPDTTQATTERVVAVTNSQLDSTALPTKQDEPVVQQVPVVKESTPLIATTQPTAREAATLAGETVTVNGSGSGFTLPAGKSVTIKFKVTINSSIPAGTCTVSNQGTVSGSNFIPATLLTDDPGVGGSSDPTVTPIISAPVITAAQNNIITDPDNGVCTATESFAVTVVGCPSPTITYKIGNDVITSPHTFPSGTTTVSVTVSNGNAPDATSSFTVTVNPQAAPAITAQPDNKAVCVGAEATFSVTASGTGLFYKWQKKTGNGEFTDIPTGSNASAATATLTLPAVALIESGTQYRCVVSNTCGGSTTSDPATLTVNPLPTATIGGTTTVCQGATSPVITFTGASGTAPYTFTYRINDGSDQTVTTTSGSSVTVAQLTTSANTFEYTLVSVKDASATECSQSQTGTATVTVNPLPTATIGGTTTVCQGATSPVITFTGASGTAPYTFTYRINDGSDQTVTTTSGSSVTVAQATGTAGSFTYTLVSVKDASATECSQSQTGTATVTITAPTQGGSIAASTTVCSGTNSTTLTLSGHSGNIVKWQSSTDGTTWTDIANTTTSYTAINLTQTTQYRAVVQSGSCTAINSATATVTVSPASIGGAIAGSATVCTGTNSTTLTLSGHTGNIVKWQSSTDGTTWIDIANTTISYTATNLTQTTQYRALVQNGSCTAVNSATATVTVSPASVGGTIAGSTTVCTGTNSTTLTLSGHTGSITKWQSSTDGTTWTDIANTTTSQAATNLTQSTQYRALVQSGSCSAVNSATATVTVSPASVGGSIAGSATVCTGTNSTTLTLSGHTGSIVKWQSSTDGTTWTDIANTTTSQAATNLTQSTQYRALVQSGSCSAVNSATATVTVSPASVGGSVAGSTTVCTGSNSTTLTLSGHTGNIVKWQSSTDGTTWTDIANTTTSYTATNQTQTTQYRALVQSGSCSVATSSVATVTISPASVGGAIAGSTTVCTGTNSTTLTLSGHTGSITKWQSSTNNGTTWTDIANTTTSYTATNLTQSTQYRAVVQSGSCSAVNSATATVTVSPASVGGAIAGSTTVCTGTNSTTLTLSGHTGSITKWQSSTNNGTTWTDIANTTTSLETTNLTQTTQYRAVVKIGSCPEATSSVATVTVSPASVGGALAGSATVCTGSNSTTLTLSGHTGSIVKWQSSTDGTTWTDIANTTTSQAATNLTQSTQYRAVVQSGSCSAVNSATATVTVSPASVGGVLAGSATVCTGSNSTTLTLSGHTGSITKWQSSTDGGTTWTDIANTTTSYTATNLTQTTQYRALVQSGSCSAVNSATATVTVSPASVGGSIAGSTTVCTGTNSTTLTLSGHTGSIVKWQSSTDGTTWTDLANTTTSQTSTNLTQTTQYRAVVQSGSCGPVNSTVATVTVSPASVGGTATATASTVCTGTGTTISLSAHTGSITKWQSSTDGGTTWTDIANTTTSYTATNLTQTTQYRALVQSGSCSATTSSVATVTISPASVGGAIAGSTTVCTGTNSTTLTLSGHTGSITKWQSSTDGGTTWTDLANTTTSYTATNLTQTTQYRAVITSGSCPEANSSVATVTVLSPQAPLASGTTVVFGGSATLTATGCTGEGFVLKWYQASDDALVTMPVSPTMTTSYYARCE